MVGTDKRIALVAEDLVKHWEARYAAMEGKAMVVCMSRRICVEGACGSGGTLVHSLFWTKSRGF
jgi:type I site-specific restriction-modification system R (restriction) subunit